MVVVQAVYLLTMVLAVTLSLGAKTVLRPDLAHTRVPFCATTEMSTIISGYLQTMHVN